jgi:L-fuconolactonase
MSDDGVIDAHQHFWDPARKDYGWLTANLPTLFKPFQPADLAPLLSACGVTGTVLVQAAPTTAETDYLLDLAERTPFVKGVVGWIDFENPNERATLERLAKNRWLKGIRPMVQDIADPDWLLKPDIDWAFEALEALDLAFDALVLPHHLPRLLQRLERHPALRVCIDHAAKPDIRGQRFDPWASDLAAIAARTEAFCKISGLVTEASTPWTPADLAPVLTHCLTVFGPERLIFGSDWPVLTLNGRYEAWIELVRTWTQNWTLAQRQLFYGGNATTLYRL